MLTSVNCPLILFPDLFPGLVFATPLFRVIIGRSAPGQNPVIKKRAVSFMHQAGKPWAPPPPSDFAGTRTKVSSGLEFERLKLPDPPPPLPRRQVNPLRAGRETVRPCGSNYPHPEGLGSTFEGGGGVGGRSQQRPLVAIERSGHRHLEGCVKVGGQSLVGLALDQAKEVQALLVAGRPNEDQDGLEA